MNKRFFMLSAGGYFILSVLILIFAPPAGAQSVTYYDLDGGYKSYVNNKLHSIDGKPSVVIVGKVKLWHFRGVLHNYDGPAIIYDSGEELYYRNGAIKSGPIIINGKR